MPGGCDPHPVRLCVCERLRVTDVAVSCWTVCGAACAGLWDRAGLCSSASLLWGWTMCGPVHRESCACVPVSFRGAFANRWGREWGEGEREIVALVGASAWGRGAGFHILFQIMMYSGASVGSGGRTEPSERQLCPEALCASVLGGVRCFEGGLSRWKLNSAHRGQRLPASRFRLFLVSFVGASAAVVGEAGKDNGRTFQVWCHGWGGVLGITPEDIFSVPAPSWQGQTPSVRVAALGVCFPWKDRVSAALTGQERIAFSSLL